MLLFLLLLNVTLIVVIVALPYRSAERRILADAADRGGRAVPIAALLAEALSDDEQVATEAAALIARDATTYQAALVSMIARVRTAPPRARLALLWAVRAILRARPELCALCWRDPDVDVRATVTGAAADPTPNPLDRNQRTTITAAQIVEAASADADPRVRRAAYANLQVVAADRAMPLIWRGLDDADDDVQWLACAGLVGRIDATSIGRAVERLSTATPAAMRRILQALARVDAGVIPPLLQLARESPQPRIQLAALRAIGAAGVPTICPELLPLLEDANPSTRRGAASAVADIARSAAGRGLSADVQRGLIAGLRRETETHVNLALLDALEACGGRDSIAAVRDKLPNLNASLRERGLEAIAALERGWTAPADGPSVASR